ncbi:HsdM family class I SAM-dependent methyltransferase [Bacillus cereus]|nr:N-6 DNA methylase [Bacillus cereus]MDN4100455.1 N-6 DNA methylase [Bacillus cereus]
MKIDILESNEKKFKKIITAAQSKLQDDKLFADNFNKYYLTIQELTGNLIEVDKEALFKNYSLETSLFFLICSIFKEYLESVFNIKMQYKDIANKYDTHNFYSWFELESQDTPFLNSCNIEKGDLNSNLISTIYEKSLTLNEKRRLGQFYTPENIVELMVKEIGLHNHNFNNETKFRIMDPACGAGIFFVGIIKRMKRYKKGLPLADLVYNSLYGNDINPFAVFITKLGLTCEILNTMSETQEVNIFLNNYTDFKNIRIVNTITDNDTKSYDFIIGNPPYFKLKEKKFKNHELYHEVMYGQPNIYTLFIYWSLKHSNKNAYVSLIVPQSFKSGQYFLKLRAELSKYRIKSLINFESRTKIFKDVLQAVIIMTIKNQQKGNAKIKIGNIEEINLKNIAFFRADQNQIVQNNNYNFMFCIPKNITSLSILEKIYNNSFNLKSENSNIIFGNGLFVWNQHKKNLINNFRGNAAPIVYSNFVDNYNFNNNSLDISNKDKKAYTLITERNQSQLLSGKKLLVQRTSNYAKNKRIKACIIHDEFLEKFPTYFLENHINFLHLKDDRNISLDEETLLLYQAILNSKLMNYVFNLKNGNTQVSVSELNLLPMPSVYIKEIINEMSHYQIYKGEESLSRIDDIICKSYNLNDAEMGLLYTEMKKNL